MAQSINYVGKIDIVPANRYCHIIDFTADLIKNV